MRNVMTLILGGGQGTRLAPLTIVRAKPAVPIGGKYRLIDIPISNCINSDIRKIYILTQFNSESLHRHINQTYRFDQFTNGFLEILAASQTLDNLGWYQGTADAVRHNIHHFESYGFDQYLILAGDHLYRMNYKNFVQQHRDKKSDITVSVKPVTRKEAKAFGILKVDNNGRIIDFAEKPKKNEVLNKMESDTGIPEKPFWGSMGIYVFDKDILSLQLKNIKEDDFGGNIIPGSIKDFKVDAYFFDGYWEDIGTIGTFYQANLALTDMTPPFKFNDHSFPIYTHARMLQGSRIGNTKIFHSIINDGCFIGAESITNSIIGIRSVVGDNSIISDSIIMGNDFFSDKKCDGIYLGIGRNCKIKKAIIDKNACIGDNVQIINKNNKEFEEAENYWIRDGIVVIKKDAVISNGTII